MQKLLGVGGLFALWLKESIDTFPDQVLPSRPACRSQSTSFYGDDLPWIKTPHTQTKDQPALISTTAADFTLLPLRNEFNKKRTISEYFLKWSLSLIVAVIFQDFRLSPGWDINSF